MGAQESHRTTSRRLPVKTPEKLKMAHGATTRAVPQRTKTPLETADMLDGKRGGVVATRSGLIHQSAALTAQGKEATAALMLDVRHSLPFAA